MGIYKRQDSPYWWMKFDRDPLTGVAPRTAASTKVFVDAPTKDLKAKNEADALIVFQQACIDLRDPRKQAALAAAKAAEDGPTAITFEDFARWYIDNVVVHFKSPKPPTYAIEMFVAHFRDAVGTSLPLGAITFELVTEWRTMRIGRRPKTLTPFQQDLQPRMAATGHGAVKAATANRETSILRPLLKSAVKKQHLKRDPLGAQDFGDSGFQLLRENDSEDARAFTRDEFDRFVAAIDCADSINGTSRREGLALTYSAVETLLRRGSLLRLTWTYYRGDHFVPLDAKVKIKRARITPNMKQYLDLLPRTDEFGGVIFPSHYRPGQTHDIETAASHLSIWFRTVCERAEIPHGRAQQGVTFHSFRHTGATWLLQAGRSVKAVMKIGGWTNAQLFLNTYCHADEQECDAAVDGLFPIQPAATAKGA